MDIDIALPSKALTPHRPAVCLSGPDHCPVGLGWMQCHILGCGRDVNDKEVHPGPDVPRK